MKTLPLFLLLSLASLLAMIAADYFLGAKAEFINAWSVVERLLGRAPSAGPSAIYRSLGAVGELVCVGVANALIGAALALLFRLFPTK